MPLSWNEIRSRAIAFSKEWEDECSENAEAKSFWDQFFEVFGVPRRRVATFETHVAKAGDNAGFIDLFWPGILIAEHKSRGRNLDRAFAQAIDYFPGLRDVELPRYVVVSDFARFRVHDLETGDHSEFALADLHEHVQTFGFIAGYEVRKFKEQDPVNIKAAQRLALLHDGLREIGYDGHELEVYLVRLLFCMFAEDTGIFLPRGCFQDFIEQRTSEDGSDLAARISELFDVLNTPVDRRLRVRDEQLTQFPYVNGKLFEERLRMAGFDTRLRKLLLECCELDWGQVSPAIFGSLFQAIMDKEARRSLGAHYTSEQNILKVIGPLFLDELRAEFEGLRADRSTQRQARLSRFHDRLGTMNFLDPACGCGNFLVIAYRELRILELELLRELHVAPGPTQLSLDAIAAHVKVDVDQFHGIEIEEWPAQIAQVAMWLMDHQMNIAVSKEFGDAYVRIPLTKSANIVVGNALRIDWTAIVSPSRCTFIFGNPPFVGHQWRNKDQVADVRAIWGTEGRFRRLDYVSCWYLLAARYMALSPTIRSAFVSTNSICQGEQVGILWPKLLDSGIKINFAHRTFQWRSEAAGGAAVHCVIVGFSFGQIPQPLIFDYGHNIRGEPQVVRVSRINPYLVEASDIILPSRTSPPPGMPQLIKGSQPTDGGYLLLTHEEKDELIEAYPSARKWIRKYIGGRELLSGETRWCLWLKDSSPQEVRRVEPIMERLRKVREARLQSPTESVRQYADNPMVFTQDRQPHGRYLALAEVSSERRQYIAVGFLPPEIIASNKLQIVDGGDLYMLGILSSTMHNAWLRAVGGRLKSDPSYSPSVYNNFPWPMPSDTQRSRIEVMAQGILDARRAHLGASLADLYDPLTMPADLRKAHHANDKAVDAAYGRRKFTSEAERVGFLFEMYQKRLDQEEAAVAAT